MQSPAEFVSCTTCGWSAGALGGAVKGWCQAALDRHLASEEHRRRCRPEKKMPLRLAVQGQRLESWGG